MSNLRYIWIGPYLEKEVSRLRENLSNERLQREADKRAHESKFDAKCAEYDARLKEMQDKLLEVLGVAGRTDAPIQEALEPSPPATLPGVRSLELDEHLEQLEEQELKAYWAEMTASLNKELAQATSVGDELRNSG